ncbi:hypothetical protein [uncultured Hymenobacter sp.]|uniref:hypothetical protein n=1 Tax=uncultured Hymenobacter sp. TaxID=170016 RepID=UPI0035CB4319
MLTCYSHQKHNLTAVRDDKYLDRVVSERGLVGYLNNAKWVKLLHVLVTHHSLIKECQVKLIWEKKHIGRVLLINENTNYQFDYYNRAMEAMITGRPSGWYAYREIEWLTFPRYPAGQSGEQNLDGIQAALASVGQIPLVLTTDVLRLNAYCSIAS